MIQFATKAENLEALSKIIQSAKILPQIRCSVEHWSKNKEQIINKLTKLGWISKSLIVRSSALNEDNENSSMAGAFTSILNVKGKNAIYKAVEEVIHSYSLKKSINENNQVFIQPMLEDILLSGVAFSKNPTSGASYVIINFDDKSTSTDNVTSGSSNDVKSYYCFKHAKVKHSFPIDLVMQLIKELEALYKTDAIDIEFAITKDKRLYLLQVRPLIIIPSCQIEDRKMKNDFR